MKRASERLGRDLRAYRTGLLLALAYLLASELLFGTCCPMQYLLGLPCPLCGMTRALLSLLRGDLPGSFSAHPLLLPALALGAFFVIIRYFSEKDLRFFRVCAIIFCVICVLAYAVRMCTLFPHHEVLRTYPERQILHRLIRALAGE